MLAHSRTERNAEPSIGLGTARQALGAFQANRSTSAAHCRCQDGLTVRTRRVPGARPVELLRPQRSGFANSEIVRTNADCRTPAADLRATYTQAIRGNGSGVSEHPSTSDRWVAPVSDRQAPPQPIPSARRKSYELMAVSLILRPTRRFDSTQPSRRTSHRIPDESDPIMPSTLAFTTCIKRTGDSRPLRPGPGSSRTEKSRPKSGLHRDLLEPPVLPSWTNGTAGVCRRQCGDTRPACRNPLYWQPMRRRRHGDDSTSTIHTDRSHMPSTSNPAHWGSNASTCSAAPCPGTVVDEIDARVSAGHWCANSFSSGPFPPSAKASSTSRSSATSTRYAH